MIWNVAYVGSAVGSGGAARPGAEGIVSRPQLVGRPGASTRVTVVSAPPGSGKTVLLRSWISQAGAPSCAAWVPVGRAEHDPQQFWLSVLAALRRARSWSRSAALQPMRINSKNGRETGDDDLRGAW
jgi:ATP/maltotriose-dependent transcriptional regulator MalT